MEQQQKEQVAEAGEAQNSWASSLDGMSGLSLSLAGEKERGESAPEGRAPAGEAASACSCSGGEPCDKDWMCPVCLADIPFVETAVVKGCGHLFCATCILNWVSYKEKAVCPTCRNPFDMLQVHRRLDGTISGELVEESVCLLLRAQWFDDKTSAFKKGKASARPAAEYGDRSSGGGQERRVFGADDYLEASFCYESDPEDDYAADDDYYGVSRSVQLTIGNRRWGEHGYVRAGRMHARPSTSSGQSSSSSPPSAGKGKAALGRARGKGGKGKGTFGGAGGDGGPLGDGYKPAYDSTEKKKPGRRARRTQKRAAMDRPVC